MSRSLQLNLTMLDILQHAFAFERVAITPYTFATVLLPAFFSFYVMAVLVQLPRTSLYRTSLLPVVYWLAFRTGMSLDLSWNDPGYDPLNMTLAFVMFIIAMRCTAWAFTKRTYARLPLRQLGTAAIKSRDENIPVEHEASLSVAMWNAWDLLANHRVIGWIGPPKPYIPAPYFRVESRVTFFFLSLGRVILFGVSSDLVRRYIRSFGPNTFGTPKGGTLFDPSLPPLERYWNSSLITLCAGFSSCFSNTSVYHLNAALFTLLFQQHPSQWPPLYDTPLLSTSLTSFWERRWHHVLFHESYVEVGSKPLEKYFGPVGHILGGFIVCAALHDVGVRGMGRGADTLEVVGFYLLNAVGMIMEYAWKKATGKHVGGIIGFLWTFVFLIVTGNLVTDVFAKRGLL